MSSSAPLTIRFWSGLPNRPSKLRRLGVVQPYTRAGAVGKFNSPALQFVLNLLDRLGAGQTMALFKPENGLRCNPHEVS